jgi:PIN domain nuclease of toxin-antitoxin system
MAMTLLLDTHVFLWALMEPRRLSRRARAMLEDQTNTLMVSSASAWEIATKHRLGRLEGAEAAVAGYRRHLQRLGGIELPITSEHALTAGAFPVEHRDPFDRVLAAQAQIEGVPLLTEDRAFDAFDITRIW